MMTTLTHSVEREALDRYDADRENAALFAAFRAEFASADGVTFAEFLDFGFAEIEAKLAQAAGESGRLAGLEINRSSRREERVLISYTSGRRFVAIRTLPARRWQCRIEFPGGSRVAAGAILGRRADLTVSSEVLAWIGELYCQIS